MSPFIDADFSKLVDVSMLETVLATIPSGLAVRDLQGRVVALNEPAASLMGMTAEQLQRGAPPDRWRAVQLDGTTITGENSPGARAIKTGTAASDVMRIHLPDGTLRWLAVSVTPLRGLDGSVVGAVANYQDLTESRRAAELVLRQEFRAAAMLEAADQGTFEWDLEVDRVARSPRLYELLGKRPHEMGLRGADWFALVHPDDRAPLAPVWDELRSGTREKLDLEYRVRHADGRWLWVRELARVVRRDGDQRAQWVTGVVHDVTARREAQEALKLERARREALEARLANARSTG